MLERSTIIHLRFLFSLFLLPIYFFALYAAPEVHLYNAAMVWIVWHVLVYPASNGYNSYYDKDEGSIALVKNPPMITKNLYIVSWVMDITALLFAFTVNATFFWSVLLYGTISKLYSHPKVRLKKYPWASFIVVAIFQGAFVFYSTVLGISNVNAWIWDDSYILMGMISACIIGASYPLTQIYQHEEDAKRGDRTLSLLLGKRGSFVFTGVLFSFAISMMLKLYSERDQMYLFELFLLLTSPIVGFFIYWMWQVWRNPEAANYSNSMRMNIISSACMLLYFVLINLL